ncbi:hypothetical protein NUACC21_60960 [Scytonema sp. NUACC21]
MQLHGSKLLLFQLRRTFFVTLGVSILVSSPILVLAQSNNPARNSFHQGKLQSTSTKPDPPDRGTPPANEGTGSRGGCFDKQNKSPLTRLVGSDRLKLTVNQHPSIWAYVPYTRQDAPSGEFSLQDGDNEVYRTRFQLPPTPGIISISLPSTAPPLVAGKKYRWYFDINCSSSKALGELATPASLTGLVQRVAPSLALETDLKAAKTPLERVNIYAKYNIWFETLTELAQLRLKEPQNDTYSKAWIELLSQPQVGLEKIAQEPIIGDITTSSLPK